MPSRSRPAEIRPVAIALRFSVSAVIASTPSTATSRSTRAVRSGGRQRDDGEKRRFEHVQDRQHDPRSAPPPRAWSAAAPQRREEPQRQEQRAVASGLRGPVVDEDRKRDLADHVPNSLTHRPAARCRKSAERSGRKSSMALTAGYVGHNQLGSTGSSCTSGKLLQRVKQDLFRATRTTNSKEICNGRHDLQVLNYFELRCRGA